MTTKEFNDILVQKKIALHDEENIYPPPTSDFDGLQILISHFLGDEWYVVDPLSNGQVNSIAIMEILAKYPNGEQKKERRRKKVADFFHNIIDRIFNT